MQRPPQLISECRSEPEIFNLLIKLVKYNQQIEYFLNMKTKSWGERNLLNMNERTKSYGGRNLLHMNEQTKSWGGWNLLHMNEQTKSWGGRKF